MLQRVYLRNNAVLIVCSVLRLMVFTSFNSHISFNTCILLRVWKTPYGQNVSWTCPNVTLSILKKKLNTICTDAHFNNRVLGL